MNRVAGIVVAGGLGLLTALPVFALDINVSAGLGGASANANVSVGGSGGTTATASLGLGGSGSGAGANASVGIGTGSTGGTGGVGIGVDIGLGGGSGGPGTGVDGPGGVVVPGGVMTAGGQDTAKAAAITLAYVGKTVFSSDGRPIGIVESVKSFTGSDVKLRVALFATMSDRHDYAVITVKMRSSAPQNIRITMSLDAFKGWLKTVA